MSGSIPNTIPLHARNILLPHPGLSVSEFFLSEENPNTVLDEKLIRELPIPGRAILPEGVGLTHLPKWVLVYWVEVSLLRNHVREPWKKAEDWLNSQRNRFQSGEKRKLCDEAFLAMQTLPWAGHVYGFADEAPVTTLTRYLSRRTAGAQYEIVDTTFFNKLELDGCGELVRNLLKVSGQKLEELGT